MRIQRERYPIRQGPTRLDLFAGLEQPIRTYSVERDAALWHLELVLSYLAQFYFQRKVEKYGQVTLFSSTYGVGRDYARQ